MTIVVEVVPDTAHPELFAEVAEETTAAERLQSAYYAGFAFYEREFARIAPSDFPKLSIFFDDDDEAEEIVFDFSLYETLIEIYVFDGWKGVLQVEQALNEFLPKPHEHENAPSAGTPDNSVRVRLLVHDFFRLTRNLLALLIRDTLAEVERKAAIAITRRMSLATNRIATAWNDFEEVVVGRADSLQGHDSVTNKDYRMKDRSMSDALFAALSEAVTQKLAYEATLKQLGKTREYIQHKHKLSKSVAVKRSLAILENESEKLQEQEKQTEMFLNSMQSVIHMNYPLGLIILDGLGSDFGQKQDQKVQDQKVMEDLLGRALWSIYLQIDEIGRGIDAEFSHTLATCVGPSTGEFVAWEAVLRWQLPTNGVERSIVNTAIARLTDDPGWFSLAHEETLHQLVEVGTIDKDSFEYVVCARYVSILIEAIEAKRTGEELSKEFWKGFAKIAATLSLLSLMTPATAEFAPVLIGVSAVANAGVLAYNIYSVIDNLVRLDQSLRETLIHPDAFALEFLARLGELVQIRREAITQLPLQMATELALTAAGAKWADLKKAILARGYYFDLETLLQDGEDGN